MTAPGRPKAPAPWLPIWQMRHASPTAVAPSRTCPAHTAVGLSAVPLLDALMSLVHDVCHSGYHRSACRQLGRFWKLWLRRHAVQLALCVIIMQGSCLKPVCVSLDGWALCLHAHSTRNRYAELFVRSAQLQSTADSAVMLRRQRRCMCSWR